MNLFFLISHTMILSEGQEFIPYHAATLRLKISYLVPSAERLSHQMRTEFLVVKSQAERSL